MEMFFDVTAGKALKKVIPDSILVLFSVVMCLKPLASPVLAGNGGKSGKKDIEFLGVVVTENCCGAGVPDHVYRSVSPFHQTHTIVWWCCAAKYLATGQKMSVRLGELL